MPAPGNFIFRTSRVAFPMNNELPKISLVDRETTTKKNATAKVMSKERNENRGPTESTINWCKSFIVLLNCGHNPFPCNNAPIWCRLLSSLTIPKNILKTPVIGTTVLNIHIMVLVKKKVSKIGYPWSIFEYISLFSEAPRLQGGASKRNFDLVWGNSSLTTPDNKPFIPVHSTGYSG